VLHVFRYQLAGRICAGDFQDATNYPYSGTYISGKGAFLTGLVCYVWIWGLSLCFISVCMMLYQFKSFYFRMIKKFIDAWSSVSILHRMRLNNQKDLLSIQFLFSAVSSLAIFVAVAATLWTTEVNSTCIAPYYMLPPASLVDVAKRFTDILKIWWTYALVDFFRSSIGLIAV